MQKITFFDATLRDGSHAVKHRLTTENIMDFCREIDSAGLDAIIVGHGNGLGASSIQMGFSLLKDVEMLKAARKYLKRTNLGVYIIPGIGTIQDDLLPAIEANIDIVKVGCHCTEADTTRKHIQYAREKNKKTYGVLMMYHMASLERIIEEAKKMEAYGANGVILMDSAGASTMERVQSTISSLCESLEIKVGFHPHNNLGMAVSNAYTAIQEGASIIDGTIKGFGAGAGNCQLELLVALLEKAGYKTKVDLYKLLDISEYIMPQIADQGNGIDAISIVSGIAGVFSSFRLPVEKAAKEFKVDPRDILIELGKRKAVGAQEDMIIEIAEKLANPLSSNDLSYQLGALL